MSARKVFCEECRHDVEFITSTEDMTGTLKNTPYHFSGKAAHCTVCGSEVYVPEYNDYNLEALYSVYRDRNGLISLEHVREIPEKYDIGKRPLSLLLGWGEQTFTRYVDGDVPTKQYSDVLKRVYTDPVYYSQILEENKEQLKETAYKRSRKAVDGLIASTSPAEGKIQSVAGYLLDQCRDITPLALQKALYYVQGFYFAFCSRFLFSQDCEAWVHGPVYRDIYLQYRDYRFDPIEKHGPFDSSAFASEEKAICDSVIKNICCYSGKVLENFTHNEDPWLLTRGDLPVSVRSDRVIRKQLIGEYFSAVKAKYHMVNPGNISEYTREMFRSV